MTKIHEDKMVKKARKKFVIGATAATFAAVLMLVLAINVVRYAQVMQQQKETLLSLSGSGMPGMGREEMPPGSPRPFADRDEGSYFEYPSEEDESDDLWDDDRGIEDSRDDDGATEDSQDEDDELEESELRKNGGRGDWRRKDRGAAYMQFGGRFYEIAVAADGTVDLHTNNTGAMTGEEAGELVTQILEEGKEEGYRDDYRYLVRKAADGTTVVSLLDCTMDAEGLSDLRMITVGVGLLGTLIAFFFILFTSKKAVMPLAESMEKQKRFITDAGHELKTPLAVIATNMDILTMDLGDNEWVEGTKKQVGRLRNLVNNLVSLSKMDEQDTQFEAAPFSISDAAFECVDR